MDRTCSGPRVVVACIVWGFGLALAVGQPPTPDLERPDTEAECPAAPCGGCCGSLCHVLDPLGLTPLWTGRAEALMLWRSAPQGLPLFNRFDGVARGPALNAADFVSGMAAGPRFAVFRHTGDDGAIEFNFLRVQSFQAHVAPPSVPGGYQLSDLDEGIFCCPTLDPFTTLTGGLSSSLQSFELTRRLPTDGRLQWLAGFRWAQWNEQIGLDGVYAIPGGPTQAWRTATNNDLYGMQIGADSILYGLGRPFRIEGIGKSGVYYNRAVQASSNSYSGDGFVPAYVISNRSSTSRVAFVGEVGATAVWDIATWLSFRAGYSAFWLDGLALASNQFDDQCLCPLDPVRAATDTAGGVFVHGLTLGLEARW